MIYVLLLIAAYFLMLPKIAPQTAPQVEKTRITVVSLATDLKNNTGNILGSATKVAQEFGIDQKQLTNQTPDELIEKMVNEIKTKLGTLPQEEALKIKKKFCADLVEEAVDQCKVNSSD
jgi:hypothetical protein